MGNHNGSTAQIDTSPHTEANASRVTGAGTLIIIGGHEDKQNDREILERVAELANRGNLLVATLASSVAEESWRDYEEVFGDLGVKTVRHLDIPDRMAALDPQHLAAIEDADLIFFTGGDQLEIT